MVVGLDKTPLNSAADKGGVAQSQSTSVFDEGGPCARQTVVCIEISIVGAEKNWLCRKARVSPPPGKCCLEYATSS
jgi:hypothetical protein